MKNRVILVTSPLQVVSSVAAIDYIQNIDYFTGIESIIDQIERDNKDIRKGNNVYKFRKKILEMYKNLA